jgi:predicted amidophosphoribosyltransferase
LIEGVDELWAGWCHEGAAAELVRALKYGRVTAAVTPIADRMALVADGAQAADLVTWVPCSPTRRRERGFDPAELLARAVARRIRLRVRRLLLRLDDEPQTARTREGRLAGPELGVRCRLRGGVVLVVDDVCTTGSTLRVAATALRDGGAVSVVAAVATMAPAAPRQAVAAPLP